MARAMRPTLPWLRNLPWTRGILSRVSYTPTLRLMTLEQKMHYELNGWVRVPAVFSREDVTSISAWLDDISKWPEDSKRWMHHFEVDEAGQRMLARTENVVPYHPGMAQLTMLGRIPMYVADAMGRDVFLYKEKINYKLSGGGGYAPHQDAPAYKQVHVHCTALLSIDESRRDNGCLEFVSGRHKEGLIGLTHDGIIDSEACCAMPFTACETDPGDLVIFSSYAPHRSRSNTSGRPRRLLYLTYNSQEEGYLRDEYYRHKREALKEGSLSLIKHFQGKDNFADRVVHEVEELFASKGGTLYDPQVTQMEHALQSASLAEKEDAEESLVVATLLHDVGHLLLDEHAGKTDFLAEDLSHETVGASWLDARFPPEVSESVRLHVNAKRYLCAARPGYWETLSPASKRSLEVQGGVFSEQQAGDWIRQPHAEAAVRIRLWDDRAKTAGTQTPSLHHYLPKIRAQVRTSA
ncbi:phnY [Symbiodinium natans]|uniref:PhnY protein n=1 Tax=Symbiodinium natans TaxID=878477 RepID=A0A812TYT0_9DINO|nr:phnY [Symbiodinium natans]